MNRIVIGMAAAGLILAAVIIGSRGNSGRNRAGQPGSGSAADGIDGNRKSGREAQGKRVAMSSSAAATSLEEWREASCAQAPPFREIDSLARHLDDKTLSRLAREIGFAKPEGLDGWVRSALFAEWGRRDPHAAIAWLTANGRTDGTEANGVRQAWFALFRGWGDTAPSAAIEELGRQIGDPASGSDKISRMLGSAWTSHAEVELFRSFARQNSEAAWEGAQAHRDDPHRYRDSMSGFFRGLETREEIDRYLALWEPIWNSPEAIERQDHYRKEVTSRSSGFIARPLEEAIAREAAIGLAQFDLAEAWAWLAESGPRAELARPDRAIDFFPEWSRRHPEDALKRIEEAEFRGWQKALAGGVLDRDPSYAVELMAMVEDHARRAEILWESLSVNASGHVRDMFPVPGQANRLANFEGSYQAVLDAVEAGNFEPKRKKSLLDSIYREFRHNVPAAAEAFEARDAN